MAQAEAGLAEFSGTRAHSSAAGRRNPEKVSRRGGNDAAKAGRIASSSIPGWEFVSVNTVDQLLAGMGSPGGGQGAAEATRAPGKSRVTWTSMASCRPRGAIEADREGSGETAAGAGDAQAGGINPDRESCDRQPDASASSGSAAEAVPLEYRRRVGQYFQRCHRRSSRSLNVLPLHQKPKLILAREVNNDPICLSVGGAGADGGGAGRAAGARLGRVFLRAVVSLRRFRRGRAKPAGATQPVASATQPAAQCD